MTVTSARAPAPVIDTFLDRHYTLAEIAAMWNISHEKARRIFQHEPGVLRFTHRPLIGRREYSTYRVPESVARRVRLKLLNP